MRSLKGQLLVASPELLAPFFTRTVILMLEHNPEGALGVILNRPTDATVIDIAEQVMQATLDWEKPVHLGGPVPGPLMVLHTVAELADQEVFDGLYSTIDADKVRGALLRKAEPSLIVANYSGWGPGQLEGEIREDSWLSCSATLEHIFWARDDDVWEAVIRAIRASDLTRLLGVRHVPPDPRMN